MQSPHFLEFQSLVEYFNEELAGAQLQEITANDNGVVLGFYRFSKSPQLMWLVFDLNTQHPFVGLYDTNPWSRLKSTKPMGLFLNSHFRNNIISQITLIENMGRVVKVEFNTTYSLEFRLIPKQPNLFAFVDKKKMSWNKPKDLPPVASNTAEGNSLPEDIESRSVHYMLRQWLHQHEQLNNVKSKKFQQASVSAYDAWVNQRRKDIDKKKKALIALNEQINNPKIQLYHKLGEHLKVYGFKDIPQDLVEIVNHSQNVSWNIQNCFTKAKLASSKIAGAKKRAEFIQAEFATLEDLSEERYQNHIKRQAQIKQFQAVRKKTDGDFRKLVLDEAIGLNCWMGKSAADNLRLLRQSKSWDLWIHLKDFPSAYAIIQKNKDQKISDEMLRQSAQWLVKEGSKNKDVDGMKTTVVIVECRHVRPIKGDKIGRVTYHNAREMLITI